jgi:NADH:ubiquinone oxidoreductase subunit E
MNLSAETEEKAMFDDIASMLRTFEEKRENLMPILQEIQEKYRYLAPPALQMVANSSGSIHPVSTRLRSASEQPAT